jgi:hypothetical protein
MTTDQFHAGSLSLSRVVFVNFTDNPLRIASEYGLASFRNWKDSKTKANVALGER